MYLSRRLPIAYLSAPDCVGNLKSRWTVVISGPAPELPKKFLAGCSPHRLIVLESDTAREQDALPASTLDFLADTILRRDVGAIVVLGQSKDVAAWSPTNLGTLYDCSSGYNSMLQRMSARTECMRRVQNRVRVQLNQIRVDARIAGASSSRDISLCGLYHVTESNAFLWYDETEDRFVALNDTSQPLT